MAKSGKRSAGTGRSRKAPEAGPAKDGPAGGRAKPAKRGRRPKRRGRARRFLLRIGWRAALVALVLGAGYVAWLDVRVRAEFEGKRWALPARVYARPVELWPGARLDPDALEAELRRSGYHHADHPGRPGSYHRVADRFVIETREFRFWDSMEPARRIEIGFDAGVVRRIDAGGDDVPIVRLDPPLIGRIYPGHHEDRVMVRLHEAPPALVAGLVAVEDHRFFEHHGISPISIARAAWANLRAAAVVQGGSTLTQQLAKNLFLSPERTLTRKVDEAIMAVLLDARYPKEELLEVYLNEVYLGQEGRRAVHGFGLASWFYFGRRLDELDLAEAALLIGLARGASAYNPWRQPERARRRRDLVLDVMAARGVVGHPEAAAARARPLGVRSEVPRGASPHPAFIDLVRRQLSRDYRDGDLRTEGLRIFTALDPVVQSAAERMLARELAAAEQRGGFPAGALQGAVLVARADNGEVLAVVGDRRAQARGFNRALDAKRPIGSLVKPAVYLAALERGHSIADRVEDEPVEVTLDDGRRWAPRNYDGEHLGPMPFYRALALSRNTAAARLGLAIGVPRVAEVLERLGVAGPIRSSPVPAARVHRSQPVPSRPGLPGARERGLPGAAPGHPRGDRPRGAAARTVWTCRRAGRRSRRGLRAPGRARGGAAGGHRPGGARAPSGRSPRGGEDGDHERGARQLVRRLRGRLRRGGVGRVRRQPGGGAERLRPGPPGVGRARFPAPRSGHRARRAGGGRVALGRVRRGIVLHRSGLSRGGPAPVPGIRPPGVSSMLMRMLAAAGVVALLGGCAGAPPSVLPPVRDGSLPGAEASAAKPEPSPARTQARNGRSAPRLEGASGRAGIPRPRPAEAAPPNRLDEGGAGAAVAPRGGEETPKEMARETREEMTRRAGAETVATLRGSRAEPELPEEDAGREGNAAVVALLESAREAEKARRYGRAAAALERALKVEPRNPRLWHRLAAVRYRQGRHPEAEALARRSMSLAPGDAKLESRNWRVIAAARHGQGDEEGAREALRRANAP